MPKRFTKKKENFTCEHCGLEVVGTGYTNHCPRCLWSKHVDINPGDRLEECDGMMRPVDVVLEKQDWILVHECQRCRARKRNRVDASDDFNIVIELQKAINDRKVRR